MCLQPVTILNPTKYVSVNHRDRFLLQVPCGKCAECQTNKSNEWLFRTYTEFQSCLSSSRSNFVMFDCLTYNEESLPYIDDLFPSEFEGVESPLPHYPCFRHEDITKFFKLLRIRLERNYDGVSCRYFLASEYGELHHRPHYHLLLFVYGKIDPLDMSQLIASCWKFGITDGFPYKSANYVYSHNTIRHTTIGEMLRSANYVTKYVQKNCAFQSMLNRRIKKCESILSNDKFPFKKRGSVAFSRMLEKITRSVNQFHRESLFFGESALSDMDLNQIFEDGYIVMPHFKGLKMPVSLPTYYKRKLFYDLIEVYGNKSWCLNDFGKRYKKLRENENFKNLVNRFQCACLLMNKDFDCVTLADYVLNKRGRYNADDDETTLIERLDKVTHYPYVTRTDKENIGIGISEIFVGNSTLGYDALIQPIKVKDFIDKYVYLEPEKEDLLNQIYQAIEPISKGKQSAFELEQRLRSLYKSI